jgi:hypothetical protein
LSLEEAPLGAVSKDDEAWCPMVRDARKGALLTVREGRKALQPLSRLNRAVKLICKTTGNPQF